MWMFSGKARVLFCPTTPRYAVGSVAVSGGRRSVRSTTCFSGALAKEKGVRDSSFGQLPNGEQRIVPSSLIAGSCNLGKNAGLVCCTAECANSVLVRFWFGRRGRRLGGTKQQELERVEGCCWLRCSCILCTFQLRTHMKGAVLAIGKMSRPGVFPEGSC